MMNYLDLHEVFPNLDCGKDSSYCVTNAKVPNRDYTYWELNVAYPAAVKAGYDLIRFYDGEKDSFGPLTRVMEAVKDGKKFYFVYG